MKSLVFNCGSSSLTFKVYKVNSSDDLEEILSGKAHRVNVKGKGPSFIEYKAREDYQKNELSIPNHANAANLVLEKLKELDIEPDIIGHRWIHSAGQFKTSFIDNSLLRKMTALIPLFPIHHPAILSVIQQCRNRKPSIKQFVTVDGAFHSTIPSYAYTYALPKDMIKRFGFRKFGFHGLSYQYVVGETGRFLNVPVEDLNIVACHLGTGGSSVAAIKSGKSIDTSMGYTSLSGLVMSTRSGNIDPMLSTYLMSAFGYRPDDLMNILNKKSGLLGIDGFSSDIRDIINIITTDKHAELAFNMYIQRIKKYIGSYALILGGMDILIFTDQIGVQNYLVREKVCENMEWCSIVLDKKLNRNSDCEQISSLNTDDSKVKILAIPTDEEIVICREGIKLLRAENDTNI